MVAIDLFLCRERVTFRRYFYWNGPFSIVKVEALDQSGGLGGFVTDYSGGLNTSNIHLVMSSILENAVVDLIINVYVEKFPNNDVIRGNLTDNSVLLLT